MEQYIKKSALLAEIEKRIESCAKQREDMLNVQCHALADDASARIGELNCIRDFIATLEVKETDLNWENVRELCALSVVVELEKGRSLTDKELYTEVIKRFKAQKGE